jgi:hypothetical protein
MRLRPPLTRTAECNNPTAYASEYPLSSATNARIERLSSKAAGEIREHIGISYAMNQSAAARMNASQIL